MAEASLYEQVMASVPAGALPKSRIRASAGVVPWRRLENGSLQVFWVERARTLPFMGGFHAFPGGGRSRSDAGMEVSGCPQGVDEGAADSGLPPAVLAGAELEPVLADGILGCVVRETFEETGLLLARHAEAAELGPARRRLLDKQVTLAQLAAAHAWRLDVSQLVYAGRWLTPAFGPVRFDNRFFLLEWPHDREVQPEVCGGELTAGEWIAPAAALSRWRRADVITAPPILHILTVLAEDGPVEGLGRLRRADEANLGPYRRIEFRPGILMFPLATPTLPPAGHTNAYVLGTQEVVLVDPGSPFENENRQLLEALRHLESAGRSLKAIWLTHHHPDHVGGVEAVRAAFPVPVCAHPATASRLGERGLRIDRELEDGDRIELAGDPPFPIRVVHTPGHARGHLAFLDESHGSLIGGDLTAGMGTIVIDPPEGDMDQYLESLRLARDLGAKTLFPAHGPPTVSVRSKFDEYLEHRGWREERILEAWLGGLRNDDLAREVYEDVPPIAMPLARRQLEAHLERLERIGALAADASAAERP